MGDEGYANPIIGGGGELVRDRMRSRNYPPDGWFIDADGDAEFNNVNIRGDLRTGPPTPYLEILNGDSGVNLYTSNPSEVTPARVAVDTSNPYLGLRSPTTVSGPDPCTVQVTAGDVGGVFEPEMVVTQNIHATGQLKGDGTHYGEASDGTSRATASTAYSFIAGSTVSFTVAWPYSNRLLLLGWALISNSVAAQQGLMSAEIRDLNAAGTLLSAANDLGAARCAGTANQSGALHRYVDLSAFAPLSGTIFVRAMYRSTNAGNTASFAQALLSVIPVL